MSKLNLISLNRGDVYSALQRVCDGLIKVLLFSNVFKSFFNYFFNALSLNVDKKLGGIYFSMTSVFYLFQIFYNFSGYMDIVIGIGKLFGARLPENFNHPFEAKNILDLWGRWHMTLSEWFKTYVFNPFIKLLMHSFPSKHYTQFLGVVAYFTTFFLMSIWHGTTSVFFIYGIFLRFSVSLNRFFQILTKKALSKKNNALVQGNVIYRCISNGLALGTFAMALVCLWTSKESLFNIIIHLKISGILMSLFLNTFIMLLLTYTILFARKVGNRILFLTNDSFGQVVFLGIKIYLIAIVFIAQSSNVQRFIYETF